MRKVKEKDAKKEGGRRKMKKTVASLVVLAALLFPLSITAALAGNAQAADNPDRERLERLEEELEGLREEVGAMKEGEGQGFLDRTTVGGYGELHFNDFSDKDSKVDFHRFVLFFGHEFNDWIAFEAEFELEHALSADGEKGEVELEQAYLDFMLSRAVNVRAGVVLVPVGIINETHEPPSFYGVERPDVDNKIIPTTWWEAGAGVHGEITPGLRYRLYLVSSLDASGFKAGSGIRGGRQKASEAVAEDLAVTGRLEYSGVPGLRLGGSFFTGGASQNDDALGSAGVTIYEADATYTAGNIDLRGLYAVVNVDDADMVSAVTGEAVGERMYGWYAEAAYRLMGHILPGSEQELAVFARYSEYDTQDEVATGYVRDGRNAVEVVTIGVDYKPHPNVVIKADYQDRENESPTVEATDQFNIGIGYRF